MPSSKRQANSPADKVPEGKRSGMLTTKKPIQAPKPVQDPSKGSLVKFEVAAINDKPYYGSLAEVEILHIWEKVLGRSRDEIYAMSYNRSLTRNFRVTFKLTTQIDTADVYPEPTFEFHRARPSASEEEEFDVLSCRFLAYNPVKPAEIGQLTRVTVKTNDFAIEASQIIPWLAKFGSVGVYSDYEKNSVGIRTDVFETEILLAKHIPEYLPIAGRKALVNYPGIPKACNNCFEVGHLKRLCKSKKKDWIERVAELRSSGEYEDELFGGWIAILEQRA